MTAPFDDVPETPNTPLVQWMEPKPMSLGLGGVSAATAGAFMLGAVAAVGVLALMRLITPSDAIESWLDR